MWEGELTYLLIQELLDMDCDCHHSRFKNAIHNHIITGDLNIIENDALRNLMLKGAKFREPCQPNFSKMLSDTQNAIAQYIRNWSRKEGKRVIEFECWKDQIYTRLRDRIDFLRPNHRSDPFIAEILKTPDVIQVISDLHDKFVLTPIDKAANNFAIICKKILFYQTQKNLVSTILCLAMALTNWLMILFRMFVIVLPKCKEDLK